jgi:hypothetical protein
MPSLTPEVVAAAVEALTGRPPCTPPTWRWWRWFAELPGETVAFVAEDEDAWARLAREAALLDSLRSKVAFAVPEVTATDATCRVQVRRKVVGLSGAPVEVLVSGAEEALGTDRYRADFPVSAAGRRLATDLGRALADLHQAVPADAARALGFPEPSYTAVLDAVASRLADHPDLGDLRGAVHSLRQWFAALAPDPVLAHRDVQAHNLAVDPASGGLLGVFDFDDAAVAHRAEDFKYLPSFGPTFTEVAVDAYGRTGEHPPSIEQIRRFHALAALEHFLFFAEDSPRWTQIVAWSRWASAAFA